MHFFSLLKTENYEVSTVGYMDNWRVIDGLYYWRVIDGPHKQLKCKVDKPFLAWEATNMHWIVSSKRHRSSSVLLWYRPAAFLDWLRITMNHTLQHWNLSFEVMMYHLKQINVKWLFSIYAGSCKVNLFLRGCLFKYWGIDSRLFIYFFKIKNVKIFPTRLLVVMALCSGRAFHSMFKYTKL